MALTARERILRKKWSNRTASAEDNRPKSGKVHFGMFDGIMPSEARQADGTPDAPGTLRCSFCGLIINAAEATFGKKPRTIYSQKLVTNPNTGEVEVEEVKLHRQDKITSCPKCVLNITPTVSRETCPNCSGTKLVQREGKTFNCLLCAKEGKNGKLRSTGKVDGSVRSNIYIVSREEL